MKKNNEKYAPKIVKLLKEIVTDFDKEELSTHLWMALQSGGFETLTDKEFYYLLEKYKCERELDIYATQDPIDSDELFDIDNWDSEEDF